MRPPRKLREHVLDGPLVVDPLADVVLDLVGRVQVDALDTVHNIGRKVWGAENYLQGVFVVGERLPEGIDSLPMCFPPLGPTRVADDRLALRGLKPSVDLSGAVEELLLGRGSHVRAEPQVK